MALAKMMLEKLPRDFSIVTLFSLGSKAIQAVLTVVIIRVLSMDDYAAYTMFLTLSATVLGVAGQSFSLAYVRYNTEKISLDPRAADTVFLVSHIVNGVSCGVAGGFVALWGSAGLRSLYSPARYSVRLYLGGYPDQYGVSPIPRALCRRGSA